jgi:ferric-dicitrate binding protein FerR (iron transport regulator)
MNRGPSWRLAGVSGDGIARVDGRPVPIVQRDDLRRGLRPGVRVQVPDGATLELASDGVMAVEIAPGTDLVLPGIPGRWWGRRVEGEILRGTLRLTSGPEFRGATLAVSTPEAEVRVGGTTLAVICEPAGTCVCVLEGHVMVGPRGGALEPVERGMRRFVFNDGRPVEIAPMRDTERTRLGAFREERKPTLDGRVR